MKYLSVDIETTGLNVAWCNVIEVAAVLDDLDKQEDLDALPFFHCYVLPPAGVYTGEPYALSMHPQTFKRIATREADVSDGRRVGNLYLEPREVGPYLGRFLKQQGIEGKITAAGKNFAGFDQHFLDKLPDFNENVKFDHRTLDPAIFFWEPGDLGLPNTKTCLQRAGLADTVSHTAKEDALQVIQLVRKVYNSKK